MTLIEVLVASVILFMSIAAVSMISQTNSLYKQRLNEIVFDSFVIDSILDEVSYSLEYTEDTKGSIAIGNGFYTWEASLLAKKAVVSSLEPDAVDVITGRGFLLHYRVVLQYSGLGAKPNVYEKTVWRQS